MDGKLLDDFIFNPYSMDSEDNEAHVCKYIQFKEDHIETYERQSTAIAEILKACSADNVSDTILEVCKLFRVCISRPLWFISQHHTMN